MPFDLLLIAEVMRFLAGWIAFLWWLWLFILLLFAAPMAWLAYTQEFYRRSVDFVLYEIRIPREVRKTPRAMEQVFTTIHSLRNSPDQMEEKWWDGEITEWISCEIASFGGEVHFYMRMPRRHSTMIKAALYAQYPDVELTEVADYTNRFPRTFREIEARGYNMFGNELVLAESDVYPIRTYFDFEAVDEIKEIDPISGILELMASVKPQEEMWLQIAAQALVDNQIGDWVDKGRKEIEAIKSKAQASVDPKTGQVLYRLPSPGETESMKAIDRNIAKPAFWTVIRWLYFSPRELYSSNTGQRGLFAAFNQYATETSNKFRYNTFAWTRAAIWYWPHVFPKRRVRQRRERILFYYRTRKMYDDTLMSQLLNLQVFNWGFNLFSHRIVMNTESLATLFHPPTYLVLTGPFVKRLESRRVGPPAGIAIYGEEEERKDLPT